MIAWLALIIASISLYWHMSNSRDAANGKNKGRATVPLSALVDMFGEHLHELKKEEALSKQAQNGE